MSWDEQSWRVGIVGCGKIAGLIDAPTSEAGITTHARAYHDHRSFQIAAATDVSIENLERFRHTWKVPRVYTSLNDMCANEELDVVSVCSPDQFHYQQSVDLMTLTERLRLLMIEKPVCVNPEQLVHVQALASSSDTSIIVNHTRRFDPAHRELANIIRSGELGQLINGRCDYYGGWLHNGTHVLDTLRMLLEEEPDIVSAEVVRCNRPGDEDLHVNLSIGGAVISVEPFNERYYQLFQLELRFEQGVVRLQDFGKSIVIEQVEVNHIGERVLSPTSYLPLRGLESPMHYVVEAIYKYLIGEQVPETLGVSLNSVSDTMKVMWQAREMALQKRDVVTVVS